MNPIIQKQIEFAMIEGVIQMVAVAKPAIKELVSISD
jgi:hypothetical protein